MSNEENLQSNQLVYLEAARRVVDELELRGFTAGDAIQSFGLTDRLACIIRDTIQGNTNFVVAPNEEWTDDDLANQA
jgi:hypothetical protein